MVMKDISTPIPYELDINIEASDIDMLGHVNNVVYVRYVQEAAVAHWNAAASEEDKKNYFWVVTRHEIDYIRPAFQKDSVLARTWVGKEEDGLFERHTELLRKADLKLLARARTVWCPINPETMRPTKVSESVYKGFATNH